MGDRFFYKERYEDIQRAVYGFLNEVELSVEQQSFLFQRFSLGTEFELITDVQSQDHDLLITGYVKTEYRELEYANQNIQGKFVEQGKYLKELQIQVPEKLFSRDLDEAAVQKETFAFCINLFKKSIEETIKSLEMQSRQIEKAISDKKQFLKKFGQTDDL